MSAKLATAALLALGCISVATAQTPAGVPSLFTALPTPPKALSSIRDFVVDQRYVAIDLAALNAPKVSLGLPGFALRRDAVAVWDRREPASGGNQAWIGHLDDVDLSSVTLAVDASAGVVMGSITMPDAPLYRIRYVSPGVHVVEEVDTASFPEDITIDVEAPAKDVEPKATGTDDGSIIDVLVVYTPTSRATVGGTAAMNTLVDLAVAETNAAYANSGVNQRLRLVYKGEVAYTESGDWNTDLTRLRSTSDGYMDSVHALRDTYGADTVSLIIESSSACGIAYIMTGVSSTFASSAFSVVARNCATGYYSFGHELGHNMSARHDWLVDATDNSPYTYNHGFVSTSKAWRTIMAYGNDCSSCTRIQRFSNPDLTFGGLPTGVAEGVFHAADNRKVLNNTASTVANFRQSVTAPAAPTVTTGVASAITATGATLNGAVSSNGASTTVTFNFGPSIAYGSSALAAQSPLGANAAGATVSASISGLTCNTSYQFQVVGVNSAGPTNGGNANFTTGACSPGPCAYSLSPLDLSNVPAAGGAGIVTVTTPASCPVSATSYQAWVSIVGITPNGGTTTVALQIAANAGAPRASTILVADRLYLVTQLGP